jgi:hypothetical protein
MKVRLAVLLPCVMTLAACPFGRDQPIRVVVPSPTPDTRAYLYSVKFICGVVYDDGGVAPAQIDYQPGDYATTVMVHNFHAQPVEIRYKGVAPKAVHDDPASGRIGAFLSETLAANGSTRFGCHWLSGLLGTDNRTLYGFKGAVIEIVSPAELSVIATYSVRTCLTRVRHECNGDSSTQVLPSLAFRVPGPSPTQTSAVPATPTPRPTIPARSDDPLRRNP